MSKILKSSYINLNIEETVSINNYSFFNNTHLNDNIEEIHEQATNEMLARQQQINLANEQAEQIIQKAIETAELEAKKITQNAIEEIQTKKEQIYAQSRQQGYEEGIANAQNEILAKQAELDAKIKENEELREKTLIELEKEVVEFIIDLTKKVLTKSFELNPQIVRFLVQKGLTQVKNFENLKIYVSEKQYDFVEENKNTILGIDTQNYKIQIVKDTTLSDTECLIETDFGTINCSCFEQFESIKNTLAYMLD